MQDRYHYILERLIVKNNISIHKEELKLQLLSHQSYPSLHSVTRVLNHFDIPNIAVRLQINNEILKQLPPYFIAIIVSEAGEELILVEKKDSYLKITRDNKKAEKMNSDIFLSQWNGIIVAIEKDDTIKEQPAKNGFDRINRMLIPFLALIVIGIFFSYRGTTFSIVHFISSIIGLGLSILTAKEELGYKSDTTSNFCNYSEKTSCDAVLNSKGATLFGFFKLSDISLLVFSSYLLTWLFVAKLIPQTSQIFGFLALFSTPFIGYSIYYQSVIIKKWCPLCLGIASVLLIQVGATFLVEIWTMSISLFSIGIFFFSLLLVTGIWTWLKPTLQKKNALEELEVSHYKFKRKFSIFKTLWKKGQKLTDANEIKGEIILGNSNAPIELILVTSPFCHFCKSAHTDIEKILKTGEKNVKITLRFRTEPENKKDPLYKIVSQALHIYHTEGQKSCLSLLNEIYQENINLQKWVEQTNIHYNPGYDTIMLQQKDWCSRNSINFTPALYINSYPFPIEYERQDILHFLDEITDLIKIEAPSIGMEKAS